MLQKKCENELTVFLHYMYFLLVIFNLKERQLVLASRHWILQIFGAKFANILTDFAKFGNHLVIR